MHRHRARVAVTIPVFNEEQCLSDTLTRLHTFLPCHSEFAWEVIIVDNGSTDRTAQIAQEVTNQRWEGRTRLVSLKEKGRGRALKSVWSNAKADIFAYMDADLSTELTALPSLIEPLSSGKYDLATGSRLLKPELTTRCLKRELVSRCYNRMIKFMFRTSFSDAQCGFKAITRSAAQRLLPQIEDTNWFFDTELLILAEAHAYRIFDLPVRWIERRQSHVNITRTVIEDLEGLWRLKRTLKPIVI